MSIARMTINFKTFQYRCGSKQPTSKSEEEYEIKLYKTHDSAGFCTEVLKTEIVSEA